MLGAVWGVRGVSCKREINLKLTKPTSKQLQYELLKFKTDNSFGLQGRAHQLQNYTWKLH